ncbi:MAG: MATE family efflux transporter [Muribaculaceae bacterium]|nr:MATE family efflux transporter [Muribaculaceae bacterium]
MNLNREILRLSVPAIVSNITVPLLGLCDTAISGHLGSEVYLAAIGVGSMMLNVIVGLLVFLRMGTTGLTATAFGAGNDDMVSKVFTRAFLLGIGLGVVLVVLRVPIMDLMLAIISPDEEVRRYAESYFTVRVWGMPAMFAVMSVSGWFVGMQSTVAPMAVAIIMNVLNIALSYALVFHTEVGFSGVAWGTAVSNWVGLVVALVWAMRFRKGKRLFGNLRYVLKGGGMGKFFSVNSNLFLRSACIMCVSMGVTSAGARMGALTLAVNVVMMQFFTFFSYFMDGFAFSGEALTGRWYGAGDKDMLRKSVRALLRWTLGVALLFTFLYTVGEGPVTSLLTDNEGVREGVYAMRLWLLLLPIVSAWAFIYDGFFVGVTDTNKMMIATLVASIVFFIVAFLRLEGGRVVMAVLGNNALWGAFLSYLFLRGGILAVIWKYKKQAI